MDRKLFFAGTDARLFDNRSIEEIKNFISSLRIPTTLDITGIGFYQQLIKLFLCLGNDRVRKQFLLENFTNFQIENFIHGTCHEYLEIVTEMFGPDRVVSEEVLAFVDLKTVVPPLG